ncbi:beta-eliminating lyase-related protein [Actinoplanes sp. NPDC026619]|uniref:threonine aldolase family protein n=1 Tax=Actinoplanes sp. NPDC026619 TaxID=3155798 RepID=UPI0033F8C603
MDNLAALRAACTDTFAGNGLNRPAELLASISPDVEPDIYGAGGVVADLEREVAELLGKPAAVFLPSGTMAQAATLRVHADARSVRTVLWHPMSHLLQHEDNAHARLHGLIGRTVGDPARVLTLADLRPVAEPFAALLLELPQRDLGGRLPAFDDLAAQVDWAREQGAAAHLDGARLWEASAGYGKPPAEIAALFDTVYVSFYKGVGALPGCCVAGPANEVAQVREWRKRLGGTLAHLWPGAASARQLLPGALAEMPERMRHALDIAVALEAVPGIRVVPAVPETPMMHLLLPTTPAAYGENARRLAETDRFWVSPHVAATELPDVARVELTVGSATLRHSALFVAATYRRLLG